MMGKFPEGFRSRWTWALLAACYGLFGACGVLAFFIVPSPSLKVQGGSGIVITWALFCLVGGLGGVVGLLWPVAFLELIGTILIGSASLTWCASLLLQGFAQGNTAPLTGACVAAALTCVMGHRALIIIRIRGR